MTELVNIKMKSGDDIIAIAIHSDDESITIESPVHMQVDPQNGFFAKSWLLLARSNSVTLDKRDILYIDDASDKAISYYEEFTVKLGLQSTEEMSVPEDDFSDLEDMFTALLESRTSTKH